MTKIDVVALELKLRPVISWTICNKLYCSILFYFSQGYNEELATAEELASNHHAGKW